METHRAKETPGCPTEDFFTSVSEACILEDVQHHIRVGVLPGRCHNGWSSDIIVRSFNFIIRVGYPSVLLMVTQLGGRHCASLSSVSEGIQLSFWLTAKKSNIQFPYVLTKGSQKVFQERWLDNTNFFSSENSNILKTIKKSKISTGKIRSNSLSTTQESHNFVDLTTNSISILI